jgi:chromosome segregation ATPase
METKPLGTPIYSNPTISASLDNISEKKTDPSPGNNVYLLNALKERIKHLEMENSQLHATLDASAGVEEQLDSIKDDLEEERRVRKGLQERLRVILEELEGVKEKNFNLQDQLSKALFLENKEEEKIIEKEQSKNKIPNCFRK